MSLVGMKNFFFKQTLVPVTKIEERGLLSSKSDNTIIYPPLAATDIIPRVLQNIVWRNRG